MFFETEFLCNLFKVATRLLATCLKENFESRIRLPRTCLNNERTGKTFQIYRNISQKAFLFEGCSSGKHKRKQVELYEALKLNFQAPKWIMIPILLRYHYFYRSPTCSTRMKSSDLTLVECIRFTALLYTKVNLIPLCTWVNTKSSP